MTVAIPKVILTRHAQQRIVERMAPLSEKDDPKQRAGFARWVVASEVKRAIEHNSFTRKPPDWYGARKYSKFSNLRYVRFSFGGVSMVAVVSRKKDECKVITVVCQSRRWTAA